MAASKGSTRPREARRTEFDLICARMLTPSAQFSEAEFLLVARMCYHMAPESAIAAMWELLTLAYGSKRAKH